MPKTQCTKYEESMMIYKDYGEDAKNGKQSTAPRKKETLTFKSWQYKAKYKERNGLVCEGTRGMP
jgi:hypothetical protein